MKQTVKIFFYLQTNQMSSDNRRTGESSTSSNNATNATNSESTSATDVEVQVRLRRRRRYRQRLNKKERKRFATKQPPRKECRVCHQRVVKLNRHFRDIYGFPPRQLGQEVRSRPTVSKKDTCPICLIVTQSKSVWTRIFWQNTNSGVAIASIKTPRTKCTMPKTNACRNIKSPSSQALCGRKKPVLPPVCLTVLAEPLEGSESEDEIRKQFSQAVPRESNLPEANPPEAN